MRRRQVLTTAGSVALGVTALASGPSAAEPTRRLPPNENVPSGSVHPFPTENPQQVSTGDWIVHRIGWVAGSEAAVEDFLEKVELRAWIDGEPVDDIDPYWGDIYEEDGEWYVFWRYSTPPKSPGVYTFRTRLEFTEALDEDLYDDTREAGHVTDITGMYEVSAGRGSRNG